MQVDKEFCMSSYLMYRYVYDCEKCFAQNVPCRQVNLNFNRTAVRDKYSLWRALKEIVDKACMDGRAALALSGGGRFCCFGKACTERDKGLYLQMPGVWRRSDR